MTLGVQRLGEASVDDADVESFAAEPLSRLATLAQQRAEGEQHDVAAPVEHFAAAGFDRRHSRAGLTVAFALG